MELTGSVQCYEWGKLGEHSFVAKLAKANDGDLDVKPDRSYAELWMGDHVNGPATLKGDGRTLAAAVQSDPAGTIGSAAGTSLPFLLKVLSIRKALSVQVHPSKLEAEKLHQQFPDIYKDANHKPELAIALTDFHALCGFRAYGEILQLLEQWEPLRVLIGTPAMERLRAEPNLEAVRVVYERLMRSEPDAIRGCIESMAECFRLDAEMADLQRLFLRLYDDFGCDVGVLSIFFLNVLHLKPGEAIYLPANVPHAYLEGDCVECMACSDNVVRAGLTPKFKDVETLLRLVSYEGGPPETMLYRARLLDEHRLPYTRTFVPPVPDFAVSEIKLPAGARQYTLDNPPTGSILLVTNGRATLRCPEGTVLALQFGTVLFLPHRAGRTIALELDDGDEPFLAFQAMANGFLETN
ncbi:probable mannose-6-phosphate isomerase [Anopheles bellator]|uniref:probable mannose-6-phosphate isomerase n=1 Tax=Anopheles bellator TaxID=139047 RepID=UPI0026484997|nr:probable mannose-6-phosphate isomerase [Anopheles bellator]XP_058063971.1 probable mannose-6-phosphate isomerase [Anopheles bellator]XP_058063972.1 probable mannose-6-phosphate isomerase [Anopheles bellator]